MQYTSTVTTKGQVLIPKTIRKQLGIKPFDRVSFDVKNEKVMLEVSDSVDSMMGFVKTKKRLTDSQLKKAINQAASKAIVENYRKKLKAGRA